MSGPRSGAHPHIPVLLDEVVNALGPAPGETCVDCTAGLGGHAEAIARRVLPGGRIILNDADPANLRASTERLRAVAADVGSDPDRVVPIRGNLAEIPVRLHELGLHADLVLADLGFASNQVDDPGRGLSFRRDGPLDMRLDPDAPLTAADIVNGSDERELVRILREFGEEKHAVRIARNIVAARAERPIDTTTRLAEVVRTSVPARGSASSRASGIDPATRSFQAVRIAVNDELGSLGALLSGVAREAERLAAGRPVDAVPGGWLRSGARVAIIAFHSLEDRPVKQCFADLAARGLGEAVIRRPVPPGESEVAANPRARSAKLRCVRIGPPPR